MNLSQAIEVASHTDSGMVREHNEDSIALIAEKGLVVLADGMGGHLHGEIAASLAVETLIEAFAAIAQPHIADPLAFISSAMHRANQRIMKVAHDQALGGFPGSTCVAALFQDGIAYWGHAGDSRLYLLRNGAVIARTNDHSMVQ